MSAAYELTPVLRTPKIDAGDLITVDIFVSGAGDVNWCYITAIHAHPGLLNRSDPGKIKRSVLYDNDNGEILHGIDVIERAGEEPTISTNQTGCQLEIAPQLLQSNSHKELGPLERTHPTTDGDPPIQLQLETNGDADPGDYEISFTLVYATESGSGTTRETVEPHLNTFREEHNAAVAIAIIAGAIIALVSLIVSAGLHELFATLVCGYLGVGEISVSSVS